MMIESSPVNTTKNLIEKFQLHEFFHFVGKMVGLVIRILILRIPVTQGQRLGCFQTFKETNVQT